MKFWLKKTIKKISKKHLGVVIGIFVILSLISGALLSLTMSENTALEQDLLDLNSEKISLEKNIDTANNNISLLERENDKLQKEKSNLEKVKLGLETQLDEFALEYLGASKVPYVLMRGRETTAVFKKLDGELISWSWPVDSFEESFIDGYYKRKLIPDVFLPVTEETQENIISQCNNTIDILNAIIRGYGASCGNLGNELSDFGASYVKSCQGVVSDLDQQVEKLSKQRIQYRTLEFNNGKTQVVPDFTEFVDEDVFKNVIGSLYDSTASDEEIIKEIWNVNTQLTTYSYEFTEIPRYSLETLSEGGGDCEDKSILVASLLKAVPKKWRVQLVYMDSKNPNSPKIVDHVLVFVDTGDYSTLIETTSDTKMEPAGDIIGWYFDV